MQLSYASDNMTLIRDLVKLPKLQWQEWQPHNNFYLTRILIANLKACSTARITAVTQSQIGKRAMEVLSI